MGTKDWISGNSIFTFINTTYDISLHILASLSILVPPVARRLQRTHLWNMESASVSCNPQELICFPVRFQRYSVNSLSTAMLSQPRLTGKNFSFGDLLMEKMLPLR